MEQRGAWNLRQIFYKKDTCHHGILSLCYVSIGVLLSHSCSHICYSSVAIILGFTIPRVPAFSFDNDTPLKPASGDWNNSVPTYFNRAPANFSLPAFASLQVNTDNNYVPIHFKSLKASVYDLQTSRLVGVGDWGSHSLPAKSFPDILVPLNFTYVASNSSDQTCTLYDLDNSLILSSSVGMNWYNACKSKTLFNNGQRDRMSPAIFLISSRLLRVSISPQVPPCSRHEYPWPSNFTPNINGGV